MSTEQQHLEVGEEVEYVEEVVYETDDEAGDEEEAGSEPTEAKESSKGASEGGVVSLSDSSPPTASPSKKSKDDEVTSSEALAESAPDAPPATGGTPVDMDQPAKAAEPAQPAGTAGVVGGSAGADLDFKQLEAQAAKVAKDVTQVAKDMSNKLTAGLRSAFGAGSGGGAAESGAPAAGGAAASLSKLAGGLTSWWGSLDPAPQPVRDETAERISSSNKASGELQELFGLSAEENLVEHFKAKLLQTYACNHNAHTPAIQMAFQGTLYVTDRHTCFSVEERGRKLPFKVSHSQVVRATRQRPARKGDLSDILKLELSNGQWLAFKDFDSGSSLDSALALVEHLAEQQAAAK